VVDETMANSSMLDMARHLFGNTHVDYEQEDEGYESNNEETTSPITDPSFLTSDYKEHPEKNTLTYLTITHLGLTGTMIIDG